MIVILDYEMGNVGSIQNMLRKIGVREVTISRDAGDIRRADKLILPGVCEDVPPGRHTGCGGDKVVVKQQAAPCKPFNIRRLCFCMGIINREHMPVAGIHQNQNYFHTRFLFLFAGWYSYLNYPCVIWMR